MFRGEGEYQAYAADGPVVLQILPASGNERALQAVPPKSTIYPVLTVTSPATHRRVCPLRSRRLQAFLQLP